ncbi:hypothetical protein TNCV_2238031 [Trichonephila clavipes]|nr:hypothetical protein TNCV_2238031 [Trichonephila clavipes]
MLDYFLWGYVKSLVYADKLQTLGHLEDNIRRVIADIRPQMLEKVIENWTSRLDYIRAIRGSHMPEIIFKIADWKCTQIYNPQRRLRVLAEKCLVVSNPLVAGKPTPIPFELSANKPHLDFQTTVPGKCSRSPEDEQENQGASRDR